MYRLNVLQSVEDTIIVIRVRGKNYQVLFKIIVVHTIITKKCSLNIRKQ